MSALSALFLATRPKQWVKNTLIYLAFFFTINQRWSLEQPREALALFGLSSVAFLLFCLLSGAVYLINDLVDLERDRNHPRKRARPIAAGSIAPALASAAAAILATGSIALSFLLDSWFGLAALAYLTVTLAYSLRLKHLVLIDVFVLSAGYVLRAVAGAVVLHVPISPWLYVVTSLGALLIGFGKRRNELTLAGASGSAAQQREALKDYSLGLLDQLIAVVAPATLISYTLYTFTAENLPRNHAMMLTIPLVMYGLFRYLYLVHQRNLGEAPEDILLSDGPLIASVLLWLGTATLVLVFAR